MEEVLRRYVRLKIGFLKCESPYFLNICTIFVRFWQFVEHELHFYI